MTKRFKRLTRGLGIACLGLVLLLTAFHLGVGRAARLEPPFVPLVSTRVVTMPSGLRRFDAAYVRKVGGLLQVGLVGSPEAMGYAHARLLYPEMVENEGILLGRFRDQVPMRVARSLLLDLAQLRYRNVDREMSPDRLREIAAGSHGFQPDPYAELFPTFQRFVYLNALYDISLSFEGSPLIGCTSFTFGGEATEDGSGMLARAFDFEVDEIFDRRKAVFLVREDGKIPFASVAWPGLVGVVSGMNLEGVAVVVHGGRAGEPRVVGEPVVHSLRRVLSEARDSEQAARLLAERAPMVSHIVIVTDARGRSAAIERAPGALDSVRWLAPRAAITNHFESLLREDPKNQRVREKTSTLPRRSRADELLAALPQQGPVTPLTAAELLRDRKGARGSELPLGDRRAINALIATHGVVMQTGQRVLWVSEAPHLLGHFRAFDLRRLLAPDYDPALDVTPGEMLPQDALLTSGQYATWRAGQK
ncbi:MAG TPA: C45 family peptidase [Polyangiaceae bacterium]|nr:C45 family peptidase [Polyangiaceae bacterium]